MFRYVVGERIGSGTFGTCFVCKRKDDRSGTHYAVKKLDRPFPTIEALLSTREVQAIRKFQNLPYLIRFFDIIREDDSTAFLVMERMDLDLLSYMDQLKREQQRLSQQNPTVLVKGIDRVNFRSILWQALMGLKSIHSINCVHRDIKPENILLRYRHQNEIDYDGQLFNVRVADFSLARSLPSHHGGNDKDLHLTGYVASRWYRAPELLLKMVYGQPVDMWALGFVACEMIKLDALVQGTDDHDQFNIINNILGPINPNTEWPEAIGPMKRLGYDSCHACQKMPVGDGGNNGRILSSILNTDEGTRRLIEKILMIDPSKRFTAEQALNDEYFHMPIKAEVNTSSASEPKPSLVFRSPPSKAPIKEYLKPTSSSNPVDVTPDPSHQQRQQERRHAYNLDQRSNFGTTAGYGISPPTRRLWELHDPSRTVFEAAFLHD